MVRLHQLGRFLNVIEKASAGLAALIILAVMFLVVGDVFGRKFLNSPIQGTIEIASLTLPAIVFLTIAYIQSVNEHVTVDLFTSGLSKRAQLALDVFCLAVGIAVMTIVVVKTTAAAWSSTASGEYAMGIVEVPVWPARILVAYGSWLFGLRLVYDFICGSASLLAYPDATVARS
jgi:TRAP-type mannitol/chloroaromatic compound transport system permease small subunit